MVSNESDTSSRQKLLKMFHCATASLGIKAETLREEQEEAAFSILDGKDTFISLPTGFGKSILYQALPLCVLAGDIDEPNIGLGLSDYARTVYAPCTETSQWTEPSVTSGASSRPRPINGSVIVVSPLTSLINDQIGFLKLHGVTAVNLASMSKDEREMTEKGLTGVIFTSPECMLGNGMEIISKPEVQQRLRGICIDESHCVVKWGHTSGKIAAFRESYSRIAEVRSVIPRKIPFVALTATASLHAINDIINSLCMCAPTMVIHSPEKVNIRYSVVVTKQKEDPSILECVARELSTSGFETPRTIVFCRTHRQVRIFYSLFKSLLSDEEMKTVAMYHSTTEEGRKDMISRSFQSPDGEVKVLFCTVAFGMGVNVKGVTRIVHFGPPEGLDDYVQESGRAGRGGEQSHAIILWYRGCFRHSTSSDMKDYLKNLEVCRRKLLLKPFGHKAQGPAKPHLCCDVCSESCQCSDDSLGCTEAMKGASFLEQQLRKEEEKPTDSKTVVREVEAGKLEELKEALSAYRSSLLEEGSATTMSEKVLCGDVVVGFPHIVIDWIIQDAKYIDSAEYFTKNYPLFHSKHVQSVWEIFVQYMGEAEHSSEYAADLISSNESDTESSSSFENERRYTGVLVITSESGTD